jgi:O-antigen ligase
MNGFSNDSGPPAAVGFPVNARPPLAGAYPQVGQATKVAFWLLCLQLLIAYSRFFDMFATGYHIPAVVSVLLVLAIVASGAIPRAFRSKTTMIVVAFTVWLGVTLPFSVWKTGSIDPTERAIQCLFIYLAVAGLVITPRDCMRMLAVLAFATFIGATLGLVYGSMETGRLELTHGSFADANEYAMMMLIGIPLLLVLTRTKNKLWIAVGIGLAAVNGLAFLRAGSRGAMIAFLCMCAVLFFSVSLAKKVAFLGVGVVLALLSVIALPSYLENRYLTFFSADESALTEVDLERAMREGADTTSAQGRLDLLFASLKLTAEHPLFGVGPGNFAPAYFDESAARGVRVAWNVCHNTYTQLSSETGILGAGLFIAFVYQAFRALRRVIKHGAAAGHPELATAAYHLWLSLVAMACSAFFLSLGYSPIFYVWAGLAVAFDRAAAQPGAVNQVAAARFAPTPAFTPLTPSQPQPRLRPNALSGRAIRDLMRKV